MEREPLKRDSEGGRYRETYLVGPKKDHVAKIPKDVIEKKYRFGTVPYPSAPYTLLKFGSTNINEVDYANYQSLPEAVRKEFTPEMRMIRGVIVQERVVDYDGEPSLTIGEHTRKFGKVENPIFWERIEQLKRTFLAAEEPLLGVFHKGSNVMVKKVSEDEWVPVLIDFKRLGGRSYPFQPNLQLKGEVQKKFLRQFEKFESSYKRG